MIMMCKSIFAKHFNDILGKGRLHMVFSSMSFSDEFISDYIY